MSNHGVSAEKASGEGATNGSRSSERVRKEGQGSGGSLAPPRLIYDLVSLDTISRMDRRFYEDDCAKSKSFRQFAPDRARYFESETALIVIMHCMDEREQDTEEMFGLPPGAANVIQIAGCLTDGSNLPFAMYLQGKVKRACGKGKVVLILMVTHQSEAFETTDSCAAHGHDVAKADAHVTQQVETHNEYGGDRDTNGNIIKRYRIAVHVKSYTDTEARVWVGFNGRSVNPMDYVSLPGRLSTRESALEGEALDTEMHHQFYAAFPPEDPRFEGLRNDEHDGLIKQMARMCVSNILKLRTKLRTPLHVAKSGHKGTRILIGRGWDMYVEPDKYFKIGDMIPDEQLAAQFLIALKYICRNKLLAKRSRFTVPIHVNGLYNHDEEGDRSGTIRYAVGRARKLRKFILSVFADPGARKQFDHDVRDALKHEGRTWDQLSSKSRSYYELRLLESLRFYVSVSARQTRTLELVATNNDL